MSQNLLSQLLTEKITLKKVLKWIQESAETKSDFPCSRGEFISHVLNFIHEEALCFETYRETPKKVHTPKSIRKLEIPKPKRRPALFSDSTPTKPSKTQSQPLSPISPLYTRINLPPSSEVASPGTPNPKGKNFCLGDFLSPCRKPEGSKNKHSRNSKTPEIDRKKRINPTTINSRNITFKSENSFNFSLNNDFPEVPVRSSGTSLKEEILKPLEKCVPKALPKQQPKEIIPDLLRVTQEPQLKVLINLYVTLIQSSRVLNVTSELYFVISLLLAKQYESDYFSSGIFTSIHNITYFAISALQKISETPDNVLSILDKATLRLLVTNSRIQSLDASRGLISRLSGLGEELLPRVEEPVLNGAGSVCFDVETDNRDNFPNDASFRAFRKQRDVFYELLQVWETNHSSDGWSFALGLGNRVRGLLTMHPDPANYRHLSRLVKSQLLITCTRIQDDHLQENQLSFLTGIPNVDTEKLNRLKTRLVAKDQSTGINALPTFPGTQEFYKELVLQAQSHVFCTHLRNVFIQELLQLNDSFEAGIFDNDTKAPQNYCHLVKSLQILAKFIGFIEGLPYKPVGLIQTQSDKLMLEEVESRSWMTPPIDLLGKLQTAVQERHLVVMVPWLVEYLAMMDATSLRLPYYEPIFETLFGVFLEGRVEVVRVCLGWLFEQQHFPSELFFRYLNTTTVKGNSDNRKLRPGKDPNEGKEGLDSLIKVDLSILHAICPFLKEFKKLLQYNCGRNGSIKHITPVTAIETLPTEMNEKRLRLQLQEAFLNSKPSSLRKTLDFVSERIASCIVKTICNLIVPGVKSEAVKEKKVIFGDVTAAWDDSEDFPVNSVKIEIRAKLLKMAELKLVKLRQECDVVLERELAGKVRPGVGALLCSDELPEAVDVCCQIAERLSRERVQQWVNTRVNISVFREFDLDLEKIDKILQKDRDELTKQKFKSLPTQGRINIDHIDSDEEKEDLQKIGPIPEFSSDNHKELTKETQLQTGIYNPSKLMLTLQRQSAQLLNPSTSSNQDRKIFEVSDLLRKAAQCHQHRSDLSDIAWHQLNQQLVDYFILLCAKQPALVCGDLLQEFVTFWKSHKEPYLNNLFGRIISVRNTVILMTSSPQTLSATWTIYAQFLGRLLKEDLLSPEEFETQCLAVFRENWDGRSLDRICQCLQDVVQIHGGKDQFAFLLGFLADYCSDLDF